MDSLGCSTQGLTESWGFGSVGIRINKLEGMNLLQTNLAFRLRLLGSGPLSRTPRSSTKNHSCYENLREDPNPKT